MRGHIGPRRALAGILGVLALALATGASAATAAPAARPGDASAWQLPSTISGCAADCSPQGRLFGARLRRVEAAPGRRGVATRAAGAARPAVTASGFEGKVTDAKTEAGVTGAEVCAYELKALEEGAYEEELEPACGTVTGAGGSYKLGVPAAEYVVAFFDPAGDYVTQLYNGRSAVEKPNPVKVKAKTFTPNIDAALIEGGRIDGTVTAAEGGAPLAHVLVCAFLANGEGIEECTRTASDGTYSVERLPTGVYEVEFFDAPEYLTQFYAGAPHLAGAKSISVTAGAAPVTGIDAQMLSSAKHTGSIEGQVTSAATSAPLGAVQVCALAPPQELVKCALSEADGDYKLEGLPEGSYKIEFEDQPDYVPQFYAGKATLAEATPVAVSGGAAVKGIDAAMVPTGIHQEGGSIEGRVTSAAGGAPIDEAEVCAFTGSEELVECTLSEADGDYKLEALPAASYKIEFFDPAEYATQFYKDKSTFAEAAFVAVGAGATVTGIDAVMVPVEHHQAGGAIEGRVTAAATGSSLGGVLVCAIPLSAAEEECQLSQSDGTYALEALPEGEYKVEFFDLPAYQLQFYDEASSITDAKAVHVAAAGRTQGIDGKLKAFIPAPTLGGGIQTQSTGSTGSPGPPQPGTSAVLPSKAVLPSVTIGARVHVSGRRASAKLHCVLGPCHGTLQLTITVTRRHSSHGHTVTRRVTLVVGSGSFSLAQGASAKVTVHLSARGARLLATASRHPRAGKLKLVLGASTTLRAVVVA